MIDLCAGTGAFTLVFDNTNRVETIFANDILDSSKAIYDLNHHCKLTKQDMHALDEAQIPQHDILTCGFSCQPFSIAGLQQGFEDPRSNVFWKLVSIIRVHQPRIVVLENVKNLQSHDNGNTFHIIRTNLEELGYFVKYAVLNTCKLTEIPQNRERIYIVCFKEREVYDRFNFDFETVVNQPISSFLEPNVASKYYYNQNSTIYETLRESVTKHINTNTVYQYRRYYVRENKNGVCPTLTANMGSGGHNVPIILDDQGIRKLTPRECFNLQGFPRDYKLPNLCDSKLYSLAGNAVSVPIVRLLAERLINLL
jgi:DNA (cytosine-5)-methyltransferase 1